MFHYFDYWNSLCLLLGTGLLKQGNRFTSEVTRILSVRHVKARISATYYSAFLLFFSFILFRALGLSFYTALPLIQPNSGSNFP